MPFKGLPYYWGAIAATKHISAILFVLVPGKKRDMVILDTCTGWARHMGRFFESGTYTFVMDAQLSKGDVELLLLDHKKQPLLKLNRQLTSQTIDLDGKIRYYLRWGFKNAAGKCVLRW